MAWRGILGLRRSPENSVRRYLRAWGLTPQKPVRRAYEQNPVEGRIPRDSRVGTTGSGANSLAGRDGIACRPSGRAILRTARPDASRIGHRSALPVQHDLFDHQSGSAGLHDFPSAFHRAGVSEFPPPSPATDAEDQEESIPDCGRPPGPQVEVGQPVVGRACGANSAFLAAIVYSPELNPDKLLNQDVKTNALGRVRPMNLQEMMSNVRSYLRSRRLDPSW